jgi:fatty-acyl-CoA synthase
MLMRQHRTTHWCTIDDALGRLLDGVEGAPVLPDIHHVLFGAPNGSQEEYVRRADERGLRCVGTFGMTEIHCGFALQRIDGSLTERGAPGGYPINERSRVRARDPETGRLIEAGVVGDIEIYTPHMLLEYYGDQRASEAAFTQDGFLRTGDSGFVTAHGNYRFVARTDDALRLSGFLVSPAEIATFIESHPAIGACQVVGVMGPAGMKPIAFVKLRAGAVWDETALADYCRHHLASYKVPVRFAPVEEFPVTEGANGPKIQRVRLREMAQSLLDAST